jgi:hypothetical protein
VTRRNVTRGNVFSGKCVLGEMVYGGMDHGKMVLRRNVPNLYFDMFQDQLRPTMVLTVSVIKKRKFYHFNKNGLQKPEKPVSKDQRSWSLKTIVDQKNRCRNTTKVGLE